MNDVMSKYFKSSVVDLQPYSSARDEYDGSEGVFLDANENGHAFEYNRYPEPYQRELKRAIASWRDVDQKSIFLGNGSDEIIDLLIRSTCTKGADRILSLDPSYGMYKVSAAINEIPLDLVAMNPDLTVNRASLKNQLNDSHKLVFICSPNNPNGGIIDPEIIEYVLDNSKGLVIVDEAYIDFSDSVSWIGRLMENENLIILQTFSKSLGAAGIRLGMAFMHPGLISFLNKVKPPYNISIPNQTIALSRLQNIDKVEAAIQEIVAQREIMRISLKASPLVDFIFPSSANFLLVKFKDASLVFNQLKKRKIIVRDRSKQTHCQGCLRITISIASENQLLLDTLSEIGKELEANSLVNQI